MNESCTTLSCRTGRLRHGRTAGYGFRTPVNTSVLAHVPGQFDNDWGCGNSSLALDLGLDGSMHIAYLGSPDGMLPVMLVRLRQPGVLDV